MPASTEQKVDFLLKKIGYSASKTGGVEGSSGTVDGTPKKPSEEAIPSPLIVPSTSIWADSSLIPATPPGSDTFPVKVYATSSAFRLTVDNTVSESRSFIARSTYGNQSSSIDGNWIDSQFGADYAVRVFKGDPNSGGVELAQAGATGNDTWFFDYSSGILNFNGTDNHSTVGVTDTNIYIVGYRYTGGIGAKPPAGIGTFHDLIVYNNLDVAGIATLGSGSSGQAVLQYQGSTKLSTANWGLSVTGTLQATNFIKTLNQSSSTDGKSIFLNNTSGSLLEIGHASSNSFITGHVGNISINAPQVSISTHFTVTGISTLNGDVRAGANLSVTGLSTFTQLVDINGGGQANTFKVEDLTQYRVVLAGSGGELQDDSKLTFDANSNLNVTGGLVVSGVSTIGSIGISTGLIEGPAIMYIDPATVGDDTGTLVVKGNLQVDGTQTTVNSSTMNVADKNVGIASGAANDAAADGAGITVYSGDGNKTWNWVDATDSWTSSEHIQVAAGKRLGFADDDNTYIHRPAADTIAFTTGGSTVVTIDENQRVGINTTEPEQRLDVVGSGIQFKAPSTNVSLYLKSRGTIYSSDIYFGRDGGQAGSLRYHHDDDSMRFCVNGSSAEKLRITGIGSVGIGTTNPTQKLEVYDGHLLVRNLTDDAAKVILRDNSGSYNHYQIRNENGTFKIRNSGASPQYDAISVLSTGNIGINSTVPTTTLDVRGTVQVSGISTFSALVKLPNSTNNQTGRLMFGDSNSLQIFHTGSVGEIGNFAGNLNIKSNSFRVFNGGATQAYITADQNSSVSIAFSGTNKLSTTGVGVTVFGTTETQTLNVSGITTTVQLKVGANPTVGITTILDEDNMASDSATALATQQSIKAYVDDQVTAQDLDFAGDSGTGAVDLDSQSLTIAGTSNEIETSASGQTLTVGLPNNVTIGNNLTVTNDVGISSNLNVTGISTFGEGVHIPTAKNAMFGTLLTSTTADFEIAHDSNSNTVLQNRTGGVYIKGLAAGGNAIYMQPKNNESSATFHPDGAVDLFFNNHQRFNTTGYGVSVSGFESIGIATFHSNVDVNADTDISGNLVVGAAGTTITTTVGAAASVGIGTANPAYMLDVAGAINSSNDVKINGTSVLTSALDEAVAMAIALG